jgi:hypothetical protein
MEEQAPIDARYLLSLKVSRGSRKPLANGTIIPYREARKPLRQRNGDHWASKVPFASGYIKHLVTYRKISVDICMYNKAPNLLLLSTDQEMQ